MYDSDKSTVTAALATGNKAVFNADTVSKILALTAGTDTKVAIDKVAVAADGTLAVAAGTELAIVASSDAAKTVIKSAVNAPVVVFEGKGGVEVVLDKGQATVPAHAAGVVDRVVVGSAGNDKIVIADKANTHVTLGSGDSTVVAGQGYDTVIAGLGDATIVGAEGGKTTVKLDGAEANYKVKVVDGAVVVTDAKDGTTATLTKVNYVQLDNGDALVFAKNAKEAAVANLYEAVFGRTADKAGLQFWVDAVNKGMSLESIGKQFVASNEYQTQNAADNKTDLMFLNNLYQQTFGRVADLEGRKFWLDALEHHTITRGELAAQFAAEAAATLAGTAHTETKVVGSITIVGDII